MTDVDRHISTIRSYRSGEKIDDIERALEREIVRCRIRGDNDGANEAARSLLEYSNFYKYADVREAKS